METLTNPKPIKEIVGLLPNLKDVIEKSVNEFNNYYEYLKDEKFVESPNEKDDEAIKRAESIYDRLDEIVQRRKIVLEKGKEVIGLIDETKKKIESVMKSSESDGKLLVESNNKLIDTIIELEERKMNNEIKPLQKQIDLIKQRFKNKKKEWNNQRLNDEELRAKKEQDGILQRIGNTIEYEEMKQIEEWTNMKIGNIIFDSNVDNWNVGTSIFHQRILDKSNLIFLIEDDDGNKFGGYANALIDKYNPKDNFAWIIDPKSFVFSLKSNGRLNGMMKFDIKDKQYAFFMFDQSHDNYLFSFGGGSDIRVRKEKNKNESFCDQSYFIYNGIQNALCGKRNFTPKRITAIQLI